MSAALPMSSPPTSPATTSATSSPGSAAGPTPSLWLDGEIAPSGLEAAPANLSLWPDAEPGSPIPATSGPSSAASLRSASLQSSLASRLRARLDGIGSPEYALTWKDWAMASGPPICARRASAHRTSGNGSGGSVKGWTTPQAHDTSPRGSGQKARHGTRHGCADLNADAQLAGWPTPSTPSGGQTSPEGTTATGRTPDGRKVQVTLKDVAHLAGWPTPQHSDPKNMTATKWGEYLSNKALLAGWPTASTRDWKDTPGMATTGTNPDGSTRTRLDQLPRVATLVTPGPPPSGTPAATGSGGASRLNPAFSLWLMGFPVAWFLAGCRVKLARKGKR